VAAPLLLLLGEAVRMGHFYCYPEQLAAKASDRTTVLVCTPCSPRVCSR